MKITLSLKLITTSGFGILAVGRKWRVFRASNPGFSPFCVKETSLCLLFGFREMSLYACFEIVPLPLATLTWDNILDFASLDREAVLTCNLGTGEST